MPDGELEFHTVMPSHYLQDRFKAIHGLAWCPPKDRGSPLHLVVFQILCQTYFAVSIRTLFYKHYQSITTCSKPQDLFLQWAQKCFKSASITSQ
jgi:hypothetical protein